RTDDPHLPTAQLPHPPRPTLFPYTTLFRSTFAVGQIAGLVEVLGAQVMNARGRDSQGEVEIRQYVERARRHAPARWGKDIKLKAQLRHLPGRTFQPQVGLMGIEVGKFRAAP